MFRQILRTIEPCIQSLRDLPSLRQKQRHSHQLSLSGNGVKFVLRFLSTPNMFYYFYYIIIYYERMHVCFPSHGIMVGIIALTEILLLSK
jgi:hypothetical protein